MLEYRKQAKESKSFFSPNEAEQSVEDEKNARGTELAMSMFRTLKTALIHNIENKAAIRVINQFVSTVNLNVKEEGAASLQQNDKKFFFNKRILMVSMASYMTLRDLASMLEQRKIGGITFTRETSSKELKKFLTLFKTITDKPNLPYFDNLEKHLKQEGLSHIVINRPLGISGASVQDLSIDRGRLAHYLYAKALVFMKKYMANYEDGGLRAIFANKCVRTIQELVDVCNKKSQYIMGLISLKYFEEHFYHHSVNVAILSILMGQKLGLNKAQLADLGMCALFHDIGLMSKARESVEDETDIHPLRGVALLLRESNMTLTLMRRLVVIYEHHFEFSKKNVPAKYKRYDHDLYARIIQIIDTYDLLTSESGIGDPELPDRALAKMMQLSGKKFDPALLKVFVNTVGIFPVGTPVLLNSGEIGIVYHSNMDPSQFDRPQVKLVRGADGSQLDGKLVDLGRQRKKFIKKAIDPKAIGVNVSYYLLN